MSVEQIEATIRALPAAERRQLFKWFDVNRQELAGDLKPVLPAVRPELELRLKEVDDRPELLAVLRGNRRETDFQGNCRCPRSKDIRSSGLTCNAPTMGTKTSCLDWVDSSRMNFYAPAENLPRIQCFTRFVFPVSDV